MFGRFLFHLLLGGTIFTLALPAVHARRDEVEDEQRLQFLRQATGSAPNSSSNSFQSRLNAIMDTTASTERYSVVADEYKEKQRILAEERAELNEELLTSPPPYKEGGPLKTQDKTKIQNADIQNQIDGTEGSFQKTRDALQSEFDQRIQKRPAIAPAADSPLLKESGTLAPSLANNPFYIQPESGESSQANFQQRKPIMASRIASQTGISAQEAEDLVSQVSNSEELILRLMQDQGMTYGEASDITS
jgi:hypothetical protein